MRSDWRCCKLTRESEVRQRDQGARNEVRGRCNHCDVEHPVEDLAGYNVRYGRITTALCNSCVSILGVYEGTSWFENLQDRIRRMKRRRPTATAQHWIQGRIEEV